MLQGLDIPDISIVVQWKVPKDLNTLVQRFGRAVRSPDLQGVAILLAEPTWFYETRLAQEASRKRKRGEESSESETDEDISGAGTVVLTRHSGETLPRHTENNENLPLPTHQHPPPQTETRLDTPLSHRLPLVPSQRHVNSPTPPIYTPPSGSSTSQTNQARHERSQMVLSESTLVQRPSKDRESRLATLFKFSEDSDGNSVNHGKPQRSPNDVVDRSLCYFINAHVLAAGNFCRRYHINRFYVNHMVGTYTVLSNIIKYSKTTLTSV